MNISDWFESAQGVFWIIGKILVIIMSAVTINFVVRYLVTHYFKRESRKINVDPTTFSFVKNAFTFLVVIITGITVIYMIPSRQSSPVSATFSFLLVPEYWLL